MYEINQWYKFEITNHIFYTGRVIEEDNLLIKILTSRQESIILNKNNLVQSKRIDSIGDINGHKRN